MKREQQKKKKHTNINISANHSSHYPTLRLFGHNSPMCLVDSWLVESPVDLIRHQTVQTPNNISLTISLTINLRTHTQPSIHSPGPSQETPPRQDLSCEPTASVCSLAGSLPRNMNSIAVEGMPSTQPRWYPRVPTRRRHRCCLQIATSISWRLALYTQRRVWY